MLASTTNVLPLRDREEVLFDGGIPDVMGREKVLRVLKLVTDPLSSDIRRDLVLKHVLEHGRPEDVPVVLEGMSDELIPADVVDDAIGSPAVSAATVDVVLAWADDRLVKVNPLLETAVVRGDEQVFGVVYERLHKRVTNWFEVFEAVVKYQREAILDHLLMAHATKHLTPIEVEELAEAAENEHWQARLAEL